MKRIFNKKLPPVRRIDTRSIRFTTSGGPKQISLYLFFVTCTGISFFILSIRLFQLTVVKGDYYRRLSEQNRMKSIPIEPQYGTITDRKGIVLASNQAADPYTTSEYIRSARTYFFSEETAHVVGYRQIADKNDLRADYCFRKLLPGELTGKKGVEKTFDCELRGVPGKKVVEVDARGKKEKTIMVVPPKQGNTIKLSIDIALQQAAYSLLQNRRGAVVALDPKTGELLALVSTPSFRPERFEEGAKDVQTYLSDDSNPLFNRATEATYPPGSVFKPFVAIGGLEDKTIDKSFTIIDNGFITAGPLTFGNWYYLEYGKTEGVVDVQKALQRSNDIFFYKLGERMGPEAIQRWADRFGFGQKTGYILGENDGLLPSPFWKTEALKEKWYLGDTYNYSIGQGYLLVTPIQVAKATASIANGGYLCKPILLKGGKKNCSKIPASEESIAIVREGMKSACTTGGTGWPLFDFKVKDSEAWNKKLLTVSEDKRASLEAKLTKDPSYWKNISIGCKTGTAESHVKSKIPHAWFTAFAPYENPEIVITVLIEESGQGSDIAGPVVRELLKKYFE